MEMTLRLPSNYVEIEKELAKLNVMIATIVMTLLNFRPSDAIVYDLDKIDTSGLNGKI